MNFLYEYTAEIKLVNSIYEMCIRDRTAMKIKRHAETMWMREELKYLKKKGSKKKQRFIYDSFKTT